MSERKRRKKVSKKKTKTLPWLPTTAAYRARSSAGLHCSKNASQIEPWPLAYEMSPAWTSKRPRNPDRELFSFAAAFASFGLFAFSASSGADSRSAATAAEVFLVATKIHPRDCVEGEASPVPVFFFCFGEFFDEREKERVKFFLFDC